MKINLKDYCVGKIENANENGIIFKCKKSSLEEEWKKYNINTSNKSDITFNDFLNTIKVENGIFLKLFELSYKGILAKTAVKDTVTYETYNAKKFLKQEILVIINKFTKILENMIIREKDICSHLKQYIGKKYKIKMYNQKIQIMIDDKNSILYDDLLQWHNRRDEIMSNILYCKIYYKNHTIIDFLDQLTNDLSSNPLDKFSILIKYNQLCQYINQLNFPDFTIKISIVNRHTINISNEEWSTINILKYIYQNGFYSVANIHNIVILNLSRYFAIKYAQNSNIIFLDSVLLQDKLPQEFFIESEHGVIRVVRCQTSFKLFLNNILIKL